MEAVYSKEVAALALETLPPDAVGERVVGPLEDLEAGHVVVGAGRPSFAASVATSR